MSDLLRVLSKEEADEARRQARNEFDRLLNDQGTFLPDEYKDRWWGKGSA